MKEVDGTEISGKLDWSKGKKYQFNGREYLEIPYIFDHQSFLYSKEPSARSQFSLVFRNLPNEGLEAAIKSTTSGKIIYDAYGNNYESSIKSYFLLNGEKKALWVRRESDKSYIWAQRVRNGKRLKDLPENKSVQRSSCSTISFTEGSVECHGSMDDTRCYIYSHTTYFTYCTGDQDEEEFEDDWGEGGDGSGGSNSPPPAPEPQPDPCATAQAMESTSFSSLTIFSNSKSQIQNAAGDGKEHGISFGKDTNGNLIQSSLSTGNENSGTTPSISNKFADIHNHPDNSPPSPGDIYSFIDGLTNQSNFTTRYIIASGGDVYALVLTDKQAAIDFNNNNPREIRTYTDNQGNIKNYPPDFPDEIFDKIDEIKTSLINNGVYNDLLNDESSLSYILQQYTVGISLLKMNNLGEFKKIKTKETNINGNPTFTPDNCL